METLKSSLQMIIDQYLFIKIVKFNKISIIMIGTNYERKRSAEYTQCIVLLPLLHRHVRDPQLQLIRFPCLISHTTHHKCYLLML